MQREILDGRSSIVGAMFWMFGLSLLLSLVLFWIPVVGIFIGPVVGGFVGGRRAGTVGRALLAAVLPAAILSFLIFSAGAALAGLVHHPIIGLIAAALSAAAWIIMLIHNAVLFVAAVVGGLVRQSETG